GVEYDFVPNRLSASLGDYIHIQWTGSNTNPNNNDGQGRAGTDRSNIVLLKGPGYDDISVPQSFLDGTQYGWWSRSYPELLTENTFLNMSRDLADNLA
ncbi:hypothetical protein, partial [Salmonella sp. s54836]|uniref:hypothetical protein n=1 Tax=Salmonella sp. s54836 TaxID=3159673 RepID=UPI0039805B7B